MSTMGLALRSVSVLRNPQPMVAKKKSESKKTPAVSREHLDHVLELKKATGMTDAAIARAIREARNDSMPSNQAVGKWWRTGKISSEMLRRLEALADSKRERPSGKAEQIARAINQEGVIDPRAVARLRKDITVLRKALVLLALATNEKTRGVVSEFSGYLKQAVPNAYYAERGFQVLLQAGLALADETEEEDELDYPAPPVRQSGRKTRE